MCAYKDVSGMFTTSEKRNEERDEGLDKITKPAMDISSNSMWALYITVHYSTVLSYHIQCFEILL